MMMRQPTRRSRSWREVAAGGLASTLLLCYGIASAQTSKATTPVVSTPAPATAVAAQAIPPANANPAPAANLAPQVGETLAQAAPDLRAKLQRQVASPNLVEVSNAADLKIVEERVQAARALADQNVFQFTSRVTAASKRTLQQLTGASPPADLENRAAQANLAAAGRFQAMAVARASSVSRLAMAAPGAGANATTFDWSKLNVVSSVKDQERCGSCWDFAAVGVFEAMFAIRNGQQNLLDLSEEQLLRCNTQGFSCCGGWWPFDDIQSRGLVGERLLPYSSGSISCGAGSPGPCPPPFPAPNRSYRVDTWGVVKFPSGQQYPISDNDDTALKQSIIDHGPVWACVRVTPSFQDYSSGLFNNNEDGQINHAIMIVGWTTQGWIIRNSWGRDWGQDGYMLIKYRTNRIGFGAAWVEPEIINP